MGDGTTFLLQILLSSACIFLILPSVILFIRALCTFYCTTIETIGFGMVTLVLLIVCLAILAHFIRDVGYYFIDAVKECISRTHVSCDDSPRYLLIPTPPLNNIFSFVWVFVAVVVFSKCLSRLRLYKAIFLASSSTAEGNTFSKGETEGIIDDAGSIDELSSGPSGVIRAPNHGDVLKKATRLYGGRLQLVENDNSEEDKVTATGTSTSLTGRGSLRKVRIPSCSDFTRRLIRRSIVLDGKRVRKKCERAIGQVRRAKQALLRSYGAIHFGRIEEALREHGNVCTVTVAWTIDDVTVNQYLLFNQRTLSTLERRNWYFSECTHQAIILFVGISTNNADNVLLPNAATGGKADERTVPVNETSEDDPEPYSEDPDVTFIAELADEKLSYGQQDQRIKQESHARGSKRVSGPNTVTPYIPRAVKAATPLGHRNKKIGWLDRWSNRPFFQQEKLPFVVTFEERRWERMSAVDARVSTYSKQRAKSKAVVDRAFGEAEWIMTPL